MRKPIIKLDEQLANMIAAGEVVERPVNIVKELVENSIDAQCTTIKVSLKDCGLEKISVIDDGFGIEYDQIPLAVASHATSKIVSENDLFSIASLGFRGEALASICSVSKICITSSTDGKSGYYYTYEGGKEVTCGSTPMKQGTLIEVSQLFYNTPARYNHLGSSYQELNLILEYFYKLSLSQPQISFTLENNNKVIFKTSGNGNISEIINEAYGHDVAKSLIKFNSENQLYRIHGFTTTNNVFRSNRNAINVFINGRCVKNNNLIYGVIDAYDTILPKGKFPITVLYIECSYNYVDVNVHPSKLEVRLIDEKILRLLITECIKNSLKNSELLKFSKNEEVALPQTPEISLTDNYKAQTLKEDLFVNNDTFNFDEFWETIPNAESKPTEIEASQEVFTENVKQMKIESDKRDFFKNLHYIGQFNLTYLLFENEHIFYIIDQHAAMERVMYERIFHAISKNESTSYELLLPLIIDVSKSELIQIEQIFDKLDSLQVKCELFGETSIIIRSIPTWIPNGFEIEFIKDIIEHFINGNNINKSVMYDNLAKSLSCKKSIKANMAISKAEVEQLLNDLDNCEMPYTCPHGRPTLIKYTLNDFEKWFKRVI